MIQLVGADGLGRARACSGSLPEKGTHFVVRLFIWSLFLLISYGNMYTIWKPTNTKPGKTGPAPRDFDLSNCIFMSR